MAIDKAVDSAVLEAGLTAIADAIREKGGTSETLDFPDGMAEAIAAIDTENAFEITPAETGVIILEDIVPHNVRAGICVRVNAFPSEAADGTGSENTDKYETYFCASALTKKYMNKGTQFLASVYNNYSTKFWSGAANDTYAINNSSKANANYPFNIMYGTDTAGDLSLYVGDAGTRGLRAGATYKIYFMTHEEES